MMPPTASPRATTRLSWLLVASWSACGSPAPDDPADTTGTGGSTGPEQTSGPAAPTTGPAPGSSETSGATTTSSTDPTTTTSSSDTTTTTTTTGTPPIDPPPCDETLFCADATEDGACRRELVLPNGDHFYYWSNLPLDPAFEDSGCNTRVERLVIVQHGNQRTPWSYFNYLHTAATAAGLADRTLIVAPWFAADDDITPRGFARWTSGGWKGGDDSILPPTISAFAVYDHLVALALAPGLHPLLADIAFAGHSAGGQFAQRHAVASDLGGADPSAISLRWIVANPSSYLYLDPFRWDGQGAPPDVDFAVPVGTECDFGYDDYKYGLKDIPAGHYVTGHLADIPAVYLARDVTYLLGEDDTTTDPTLNDLDVTCPAQLQGAHRLERGQIFQSYLDARYPGHAHATHTVPGVAHSASGMFTSSQGVAALFP